ncbi:MAG: zinc ribbon domain-containing protein [Candidatus Nanoarchaeia archaeon]
MANTHFCESCGMSIKGTNKFCTFCAPDGKLLPLSELIEKFAILIEKKHGLSHEQAIDKAITHLKKMPAWKDLLKDI